MWAWITSVSVRRTRAQVRGPGRAAWCTHAGAVERRGHPLPIATEDDDLETRLHLGRRHVGEVALHAGERRRGDEVDDLHRSARRVIIAAHGTGPDERAIGEVRDVINTTVVPRASTLVIVVAAVIGAAALAAGPTGGGDGVRARVGRTHRRGDLRPPS